MANKFITFLFFFTCCYTALAQNDTYTVNVNNGSLLSVIADLEQRYELNFSFKQEGLSDVLLTAKINEKNLNTFLTLLFDSSDIEYNLLDDQYIVLFQKEAVESSIPKIVFCGRLFDQENKEVLSFANVFLKNQSAGTESTIDGSFELEIAQNSYDSLYFSYIGYETKAIALKDFQDGKCKDILLKPSDISQAYVIVTDYIGTGISLENNGLSTNLNPRIIGVLPGQVEEDVLKTIQFLPGVSSPSSRVSDLHIRGCTPDQNLLSWEGIPMYHTAHYFGMISAINPFIIKEAKVYRSGFSADFGGRIASVIDLKSTRDDQTENYIGVGSNMTHAYVYGNQYLNKNEKTSVTFSLRRSYTELLKTPTIKNITKINQQGLLLGNKEVESLPNNIMVTDDINFLDANIKFQTQINENNRLSISGLLAENNFSDEIVDSNRREVQVDTMNLQSTGLNLNYQTTFSERFKGILKASYSSYFYNYEYQLRDLDISNPKLAGLKYNKIIDRQIQLSGKYNGKNNQELEVGYHLINYDLDFEIDEVEINDPRPFNDIENSKANLHSLYANFKNPISNKLGMNIGLRTSYFSELEKIFFEPRINLSYQINDRLSAHGNFGRHHQFIYQLIEFRGNSNGINFPLWYLSGNREDPVQKANVYQLGFVFENKGFVIDLQAYKRDINGLSSRSFDFSSIDPGSDFVGNSDVLGLDIMLKKRVKFFKTWLSYSLSKTEFRFSSIQDESFPSDFDQRHVINWTNQLTFHRFKIGLAYQFASGLPYSLLSEFKPIGGPGPNQQFQKIYDGINNYNLDPTHKLNISVNYTFKPGKKGMQAYLGFSLLNVFNRENLYNRTFNIDQNQNMLPRIETIDKTMLLRTPNLSFRMEW